MKHTRGTYLGIDATIWQSLARLSHIGILPCSGVPPTSVRSLLAQPLKLVQLRHFHTRTARSHSGTSPTHSHTVLGPRRAMWSSYFTASSASASRSPSMPDFVEIEPKNSASHYVRLVRKPSAAHVAVQDSALSPHYVRLVRVKSGSVYGGYLPLCPSSTSPSSTDAGRQLLVDLASIAPCPRTPSCTSAGPLTWV